MAYLEEQEPKIRRNFQSMRFEPMFDLLEQHLHHLTTLGDVLFTVIRDIEMITCYLDIATRTNPNYVAFQLCLEHGKKKRFMCKDQRATLYLGGIFCLILEVTYVIKQHIRQKGSNVLVKVSSSDAPNFLVIPPKNAIAFFVFDAAGYDLSEGEDDRCSTM
ncbi:unnamed protein product [Arabis nemorensis]|uniref:Uncharacterized protein n=1 Tax=Arabis nemorensis TaxID=586526 RepID=A0A565CB19_9BRAS|nr:unnamed protein product [Arabis nemorensis]